MGTYTTEAKVEAVTQFDIDATTNPNSTEVATWITEVEADADARALGSYTLTDQLVDVFPKIGTPAKDTIAWLEQVAGVTYDEVSNLIIIPPFTPIVSISSLSKRTSSLGSTDSWTSLTEGTTVDTSYIQLKKRTKTNQYLGFAIYFHHNNPEPGYQRVKMTYNYGWNLSTDIIGEWCTLKVALKVLQAELDADTPVGAGDYSTGDMRVGINIEGRIGIIKERLEELEEKYFPTKELGIAIV